MLNSSQRYTYLKTLTRLGQIHGNVEGIEVGLVTEGGKTVNPSTFLEHVAVTYQESGK